MFFSLLKKRIKFMFSYNINNIAMLTYGLVRFGKIMLIYECVVVN